MISAFSIIYRIDNRFSTMHSDRLLLRKKSDASGNLLLIAPASLMQGGIGVYEFSSRDKRFIYHESEEIWNQADSPTEVLFTLGQGIVRNEKFDTAGTRSSRRKITERTS
jgi:hypothetical protein